MTHAETHSTNVSAASIAPNKAKAITETTASVSMGKETYKTEKKEKTKNDQGEEEEKTVTGSYTNLALITQNNASRRAIIGNMSIGLLASIGTGDAKTEGNDKSLVEAKGGADDNEAANDYDEYQNHQHGFVVRRMGRRGKSGDWFFAAGYVQRDLQDRRRRYIECDLG